MTTLLQRELLPEPDLDAPCLWMWVPLPPPDNHCHRSGQYSRYATAAYRDWLAVAGPRLQAALGAAWEPDTERWWEVRVTLRLPGGARPDGQNLLKPLLDLLSGKHTLDADGEAGRRGQVVRGRGLWNDDNRLQRAVMETVAIGCPPAECGAELVAVVVPAPEDRRKRRKR